MSERQSIPLPNTALIPRKLKGKIEQALHTLLSEKHLYQSVAVDIEFISEEGKSQIKTGQFGPAKPPTIENLTQGMPVEPQALRAFENRFIQVQWDLRCEREETSVPSEGKSIAVQLPFVKTVCSKCEERQPFNPVKVFVDGEISSQCFLLVYQCQGCRKFTRFLVQRDRQKITLVGRSPIEFVDVPSLIPKQQRDHFRNATVAHNCGQTLAGIFLLRVFVEQFWKSLPGVIQQLNGATRPTGEELGTAYNKTLPEDFRSRFPSLPEVYGSLSAAIHEAKSSPDVFEDARDAILQHFDARRLFKLC